MTEFEDQRLEGEMCEHGNFLRSCTICAKTELETASTDNLSLNTSKEETTKNEIIVLKERVKRVLSEARRNQEGLLKRLDEFYTNKARNTLDHGGPDSLLNAMVDFGIKNDQDQRDSGIDPVAIEKAIVQTDLFFNNEDIYTEEPE